MLVSVHRPLARRTRDAFTLLEVLVVVAIIVILAGVATVSMFRYLEDAKADAARAQMDTLEKACQSYMVKNDGIPPESLQELVAPQDGSKPLVEGGVNMLKTPFGNTYNYDSSHVNAYNSSDPMVSCQIPGGAVIYSPRRTKAGQ